MGIFSPGFRGRGRPADVELPPGQYLEHGFPVLSIGPTQRVKERDWRFTVTTETGRTHVWDWQDMLGLGVETIETDIHCVTSWSKLGTTWKGVSLDRFLDGVDTSAGYAMQTSTGGYTTNLALDDLRGGKAWVAFEFDGKPLSAEHGGPARMLVPHLYFWKSAKWIEGLRLMDENAPGFWERNGYHERGEPWAEQRYWGS